MARKKNKYYYDNTHAYDEAIKALRTNIQFSNLDDTVKTIVITSSMPSEGKSTVAVSLAKSFAQNGKKVLLMDCDLRNPTVAKYIDNNKPAGLTNVLIGRVSFLDALISDEVERNMDVLLTGPTPPNPSEVLSSKAMHKLLEEVKPSYDYVIIDTPPVGIITDATILSTQADGVIIVTKYNETKLEELKRSKETIESVGSRILGVVINSVPSSASSYGSYY